MPSGRPGMPSELLSLQEYVQDHVQDPRWWQYEGSQLSAPPLQPFCTVPPFPYAPDQNQQNLAFLQSTPLQQYTVSQAPHQHSLPSSYLAATTPSGYPVSRQRHSEEDTTTSFRGVEDSLSGYGWRIHNGDGSHLSSTDGSGRQIVQESLMEPGNPGAEERGYTEVQQHLTEQSTVEGINALRGIDSWRSCSVQGGVNVSDDHYRSDSMRFSLNCRSATDKREAFSDTANQNWNPAPIENNPVRQSQWKNSQEIDNPVDPSTRFTSGIAPSLLNRSFSGAYEPFVKDVDKTKTGAFVSQNERFPRDLDDFDVHSPSSLSTFKTPRYDPESKNVLSPTASDTTPRLYHDAHSQLAPESSKRCKLCDDNPGCERRPVFRSSTNLRRHMREHHSGSQRIDYKCLLNKDGSACETVVKKARYRRSHVESVHQRESRELPPIDAKKRPNNETDKMLDKWFAKEVQSST